ncbi:MAG: hypothetical protein M0P07_04760 [Candidatus Methanomethylophilaceae archaeon]|nr:hypothetical protein [Candidatus Methanomethylophilaceae archaeon]MDY0246349.1 hypothetical protein [Methanosarcina mazei]
MAAQKMDRETTLGELIDSIEDSPWVYCGSDLIASPADDLFEQGSYTDYLNNLKLSKFDVDSYEYVKNIVGEEIFKVYLDPFYEGHIKTSDEILDNAKDLVMKYDLTKQQGLAAALINFADLPKAKAAKLLNISPQALGSAYITAQTKINTLNDNSE